MRLLLSRIECCYGSATCRDCERPRLGVLVRVLLPLVHLLLESLGFLLIREG